jgi:hypothetical protein
MGTFNTADRLEMVMKSRPIPVEWFGWRSDTVTLQQYGWQFAAHTEPMSFVFQFVMKHNDMALMALFDDYVYDRALSDPNNHGDVPPLIVQRIAPRIEVSLMHTTVDFSKAHQFDMQSSFSSRGDIKCMDDLIPFNIRVPGADVREVVIESQADMDVVDHLQQILDQQEVRQAEIRRDRMNRPADELKERQVKFQVVA